MGTNNTLQQNRDQKKIRCPHVCSTQSTSSTREEGPSFMNLKDQAQRLYKKRHKRDKLNTMNNIFCFPLPFLVIDKYSIIMKKVASRGYYCHFIGWNLFVSFINFEKHKFMSNLISLIDHLKVK